MRSLVSSRMLDRLAPGFFPSTMSIEANTPTRSSSGATVAAWAPLAGHKGIPCALSPVSGGERRTSSLTTAETTHAAMLSGRFPAISPSMRAVVAGKAYDITAVDEDSQGVLTRLGLRVVTPSGAE